MISGFSSIAACVPCSERNARTVGDCRDFDAGVTELQQLLGRDDFDEIYYSHDVIGVFYAMLAQSYPRARRSASGDGLGSSTSVASTSAAGHRGCRTLGHDFPPPFGHGTPRPHEAVLALPVDQSGHFLDEVSLRTVPRAVVPRSGRADSARIAKPCNATSTNCWRVVVLDRKFMLMTENNAEGNFMSFERDVEMYWAVVRKYCPSGSVSISSRIRARRCRATDGIRRTLGSEFEVHELDDRFKRYPVEFMGGLVRACKHDLHVVSDHVAQISLRRGCDPADGRCLHRSMVP
jgi:hypothetical protein